MELIQKRECCATPSPRDLFCPDSNIVCSWYKPLPERDDLLDCLACIVDPELRAKWPRPHDFVPKFISAGPLLRVSRRWSDPVWPGYGNVVIAISPAFR